MLREKSAKFWECQFVTESSLIKMPDIRAEISSFSKQTENVLVLLLRENEDLKSMLKGRVSYFKVSEYFFHWYF